MARDFNPSNEPGTCIYCGARLRQSVFKAHTIKRTVSLCCQAPVESQMFRDPKIIASWRSGYYCTACKRELVGDAEDTEVQVTEVPEKRSAVAGYADLFCTRDCGYQFGLIAALQGVRYVKKES